MRPKRPRHSAKRKQAVLDGYRSALEAEIARDLTARGIKFEYETRKLLYVLAVRGGTCSNCGVDGKAGKRATYTPDFRLSNGVIVEVKGYFTARDRTKLLAVRSSNDKRDLRLLFAADNWCTKQHRLRYSEWAAKHGFVYHVGKRIPESWTTDNGQGKKASTDLDVPNGVLPRRVAG